MNMSRRTKMILPIAAVVTLVVLTVIQIDGEIRAVNPDLSTTIQNSSAWFGKPLVVASDDDPEAVAVVVPAAPVGGGFAAVRIDVKSGTQTPTEVTIGPGSRFRPFIPASTVHAEVHGLRFDRPALHVMTFPDGKGPGIHYVDSSSGQIAVILEENDERRILLTCNVFNSSRIQELLSLVSTDPGGKWIAILSRASVGWKLYMFSRRAMSSRSERTWLEMAGLWHLDYEKESQ